MCSARSKQPSFLKLLALRLGLIAFSTLLCLGALELALRLVYPKYQYAAESDFERDSNRIWSRNPNSQYQRKHPDTLEPHWVYHNNLALRQHRDFSIESLQQTTNLGFFGDSFTENLRMPAPYSFTEPLDYLLNHQSNHYNVLNFGIDGYGADQAYLYYLEAASKIPLKHVFYIFSANDIRNIYENQLFELDANGKLRQKESRSSPWWVRMIARFHLTYLVIEGIENLIFKTADQNKQVDLNSFLDHAKNYHNDTANSIEKSLIHQKENPQLDATLKLFNAIIQQWQNAVTEAGGYFYFVVIPRKGEHRSLKFLDLEHFNVINSYTLFSNRIDQYDYKKIKFENDNHWNENGNALFALELYEQLAPKLNLSTSAQTTSILQEYYAAFPIEWISDVALASATNPTQDSSAIKNKYTALESTLEH